MVSRLSPIPPARTCSTYRKASTSPCPATSLRSVPASRRRTTTTGYSRGQRRTGRGRDGGPGMRRAGPDRGLTVSEKVSPVRGETSGPADAPVSRHADDAPESQRAPAGARKHGRFRWVVPGVAVVLVAGGVLTSWRTGVFSRPATSGGGQGAA